MTNEKVKNNFVQNLAENAYINMCSVEEMNIAISALEKQIPKKPKNYLVNMKCIDFLCPNCKKKIISKIDGEWVAGKNQKFCDECGQALDWSEVEE